LRTIAALAVLAAALPAAAQQELRTRNPRDWKTLKTEHFEIHFPDEEIEPRVREIAGWAEGAYAKISAKLGTKFTRAAPIFVYRSHNDFQSTTVIPGGLPEGVLGVTELFQDRIVIPCVGSDKLMQRLIEHEVTHQMMFQEYYDWKLPSYLFLKDPFIPDWFVEGLAEWSANAVDTWEVTSMRDMVLEDRMHHLYNLHGFGHLNPGETREAYLTGHWALRWIEESRGAGSVKKVYERWNGFPWPASARLKPVTKKSYKAFDREFRDAMRRKFIEDAAGRSDPDTYATALTRRDSYYRRSNLSPRVSPDGKRIAYLSDRSNIMSAWVMNADGTGRTSTSLFAVNNSIEFVDDSHSGVTWSPDGSRIAFVGEWGQRKDIWLTSPDGGGEERLKLRFEELSSPAWSPDGAWIAFSGLELGRTDLWIASVETSELRRVTKDRWHDDTPCWSPDGRTLVYASEREGQTDLWAVDVTTGEQVAMTATTANEITPQFSPDGKHLAFASDEGGAWNIQVMELEGGRVQAVTNVIGAAVSPSWGPGGALVFAHWRRGEWHVWSMRLEVEAGEWKTVSAGEPREWYADLFVKPVEEGEVRPLSDRWHLDFLFPVGFINLASASTLTGSQIVAVGAGLAGTEDGVRVEASATYLNVALSIGFVVSAFNVYESFEERDVDREEHRIGLFGGTILPLDPYRTITLGYTLYENRIKYEEDDLHNTDPRNGAVVAALTHDNVHGRGLNPLGGFHFTGGARWYRDFWGSEEERTVYFWEYRQYIRFWEDIVLALRCSGHLSHGPQADVEDVGSVVRGYSRDRIEGRNVAGASAEVRFPLWRDINWSTPGQFLLVKDLRGFVFADAGFATDHDAHQPMRRSGHPDWRHSVGGGIRVDLFALEKIPVPLTLQVAQPTDSHQRLRVSLLVGISF
jgi:hypothetical protein